MTSLAVPSLLPLSHPHRGTLIVAHSANTAKPHDQGVWLLIVYQLWRAVEAHMASQRCTGLLRRLTCRCLAVYWWQGQGHMNANVAHHTSDGRMLVPLQVYANVLYV